jgi:hypothetical protein
VDVTDESYGGQQVSQIHSQRMTAEMEGDFVVFMIGLRINKPWKIHKWWPVFSAMPRMLRELASKPELGMLGYVAGFKVTIQYWKSFDHLEAYARSREGNHLPAWTAFNESLGKCREDVGIWHETYQVRAGEYECVYSGMPAFGLGVAGKLVPASGKRDTARGRIKTSDSQIDREHSTP